jgi:1,4-dihydroxy-2-naphthoate octaprenyltransferase
MGLNLKIWIIAARPKTLWASIAPVLIGSAMAYNTNNYSLPAALITLISAVFIQIATNYANDYFDYQKGVDRSDRIGPIRATQAGLIKPQCIKNAFIFLFIMAFLIGLYLVWRAGWPILIIGISSILFGILYTTGPYPLSHHGLGDIFVIIFFGPVAVGGTYTIQTLECNWIVITSGLSPGLLSTAILTVNNLRDIHSDRKSGKNTLAVRLGEKFARYEYLCCIILATIIPFIIYLFEQKHPYSLLTSITIFIALPIIRSVFVNKIDSRLNKALAQTASILLLYSIIFSITWNL